MLHQKFYHSKSSRLVVNGRDGGDTESPQVQKLVPKLTEKRENILPDFQPSIKSYQSWITILTLWALAITIRICINKSNQTFE